MPDVVATLKHFAGHSASQAARNHAPVSVGPRTLRDVLLLPFEMALREGGARSVMTPTLEVSCTVHNEGDRAGTEVVQLLRRAGPPAGAAAALARRQARRLAA